MPVKDRVIFVPRGPRGMAGPQGPAGNSSVDTARVDNLESITATNLIYWDATNGNDQNIGNHLLPVRTAAKVCDLLRSGVTNLVFLKSNVVWDHYKEVSNDLKIHISGDPTDRFSVTFTDAVNSPTKKAGLRIGGYGTFIFLYTKLILDGTISQSCITADIGKWKIRSFATEFEAIPGSNGYLYGNQYGGELVTYFQGGNMTNMDGRMFEGVGAGQNPNERVLVYCNLQTL